MRWGVNQKKGLTFGESPQQAKGMSDKKLQRIWKAAMAVTPKRDGSGTEVTGQKNNEHSA